MPDQKTMGTRCPVCFLICGYQNICSLFILCILFLIKSPVAVEVAYYTLEVLDKAEVMLRGESFASMHLNSLESQSRLYLSSAVFAVGFDVSSSSTFFGASSIPPSQCWRAASSLFSPHLASSLQFPPQFQTLLTSHDPFPSLPFFLVRFSS